MCLLFSWVQNGNQDGDVRDGLSSEQYPMYVYCTGLVAEANVPESLTVTVKGSSVTVTNGQLVTDIVLISDCEAVSVAEYGIQLYMKDRTLYVISLSAPATCS